MQLKCRHLVVKFTTNASGAMWLPNLVTESISGSVVPLAMFCSNFTWHLSLAESELTI